MTVDALAKLGERQPARLLVLVAHDHGIAADETAGERHDAHEAPGQDLEQVLVERHADLDREPRLLLDLADQRRPVVLAGIGPPAGQIPFVALVQEQEHAILVD